MSNLVWTKLDRVWWVGEKLDNPPDDLPTGRKKKPVLAVVKFFDDTEELCSVYTESSIVDYATKKEENILKGLKILQKNANKTTLDKFIFDVKEAEKRIGGDEDIIEKLSKQPTNSTPVPKSVVKEIFKPVEEISQQQQLVATPGSIKFNFKKNSPRKSRGPTPQISTGDNKKYSCDKCEFTSDRVGVISSHMRVHTGEPAPPPPRPSLKTPQRRLQSYTTSQTPVAAVEKQSFTKRNQKPPVAKTQQTPQKVATPRKGTPRKRKLPAPPIVAKEEILGDWTDGEEDIGGTLVQPEPEKPKKPRTDKDFQSLFDTLVQSKQSTNVTSTQEVEMKEETKVKVEEIENDSSISKDGPPNVDTLVQSNPSPPQQVVEEEEKVKVEIENVLPTSRDSLPVTDTTPVESKQSKNITSPLQEEVKVEAETEYSSSTSKDDLPIVDTTPVQSKQSTNEVVTPPPQEEVKGVEAETEIVLPTHKDSLPIVDTTPVQSKQSTNNKVVTSPLQEEVKEVVAEIENDPPTSKDFLQQQLHVVDTLVQSKQPTNKTPSLQQVEVKADTEGDPVEQIVHLVPVQNPDGSVAYMFISLNDNDELKIDRTESDVPPPEHIQALYIDKDMDYETLMQNLTSQPHQQQQQQQQLQMLQQQQLQQQQKQQLQVSSQAPSRQPPVSQQFKQMQAAAASTSQQQTQIVTETCVPIEPQQYIIDNGTQEMLNIGPNTVSNTGGPYLDLNQLSRENNILFLTEDGSIFDPTSCGVDFQQLFSQQ